jgi:regulatory protein
VRITRIERLRGTRKRYAVHLDGVKAFEVGEAVAGDFRLATGDDLDAAAVSAIQAADDAARSRDIALNYISFRPRSSREVLDHLRKKGLPRPAAEKVVARFIELRLIDDLEFARMFVRDRMRRKRTGTTLLRQQLLARGITGEAIDRVFAETIDDTALANAAASLIQKRVERSTAAYRRLEPAVRRQRLIDYLLRRGFSYDIAQRAVRSITI